MAIDYTNRAQQVGSNSSSTVQNAGLRAYMIQVYNYMGAALAVTGLVAWFVAQTPALMAVFHTLNSEGAITGFTGLGWAMVIAPLIFVVALSAGLQRFSLSTLFGLFWGYAVVMGLSLSSIFLTYTDASITRAFFMSAGMFGSMSLIGYTTKKDLTGLGFFLMVGLLTMIVATLLNSLFFHSTGMQYIVSLAIIAIFMGMTAYDVQAIKNMYFMTAGNSEGMTRAALQGALKLYLDFINIFIYLLRFVGDRRQ
jgi:FtsH-binding integral membrane protein